MSKAYILWGVLDPEPDPNASVLSEDEERKQKFINNINLVPFADVSLAGWSECVPSGYKASNSRIMS